MILARCPRHPVIRSSQITHHVLPKLRTGAPGDRQVLRQVRLQGRSPNEPGRTGPDEYDMASILVNRKSEGLAILLSFIITGLGQMYVGRIGRGISLLVAQIVMSLLAMMVLPTMSYSSPGAVLAASLTLMLAILILWIYSMYDAYSLAKEHNQELLRRGGGYR